MGLVALPVEQAIDASLETITQRVKEDSDHPGCQQRDDQIALRLKQGPECPHDKDIDADHAGRQQTVHQRAVDDHIDVPQPVAQHADANGERDGEEDHRPRQRCSKQLVNRVRPAQRREERTQAAKEDGEQQRRSKTKHEPFDLLTLEQVSTTQVAVEQHTDRAAVREGFLGQLEQWGPVLYIEGGVRR